LGRKELQPKKHYQEKSIQKKQKIMTLQDFMVNAKQKAFELGISDVSTVSVYAFAEFENTYYVCQISMDEQVLRAPIMHSPVTAVEAFGDAIRHYQENGNKKKNTDIVI
jgi:hypothetical protein